LVSQKSLIRRELFRCALKGEFLYYGEFRDRLWPRMSEWREEWSKELDVISHEETNNGYPMGHGRWNFIETPSSTVFLNCMAEKGYTLAKDGWDTGVLWTLPYRPAH
jgi:hypothetical protein